MKIDLKADSSHPTESSLFNAMINHAMPYLKFFDISCDNIEKEDRQNIKVNNFKGNVKMMTFFRTYTSRLKIFNNSNCFIASAHENI
ncbi:MAG: hypothetical protein L6V87_02260 [Ruminococcus sp.]|nr:MAG: hypothetical protein L6V87_02260 [Ruminococcus sp.]